MTNPADFGHEVAVVKRMPDGTRRLPSRVKLTDDNLPLRLQPGHVVTPEELAAIDGLTPDAVATLISQSRADVLATVNAMLQALPIGRNAFVYEQIDPVAAKVIEHGLGRRAVAVSVYSLDYSTQYEFFELTPQSPNTATIAFDLPLAFVALFS